jgi:probable HAF family extracellular repeat protein
MKSSRKIGFSILAVAVVGFSALQPAAGQPQFTATDLGSFGGNFTRAIAINGSGQVVGYSATPAGPFHAFLWLPEPAYGLPAGINDLGTLGGETSFAWAINDSGQVVGQSNIKGYGDRHAFLWLPEDAYGLPAGMNDLGTLGPTFSYANGINSSGQVVGASRIAGQVIIVHAFLYSDGTMQDLDPDPLDVSHALAINDCGVIVGDMTYRPQPYLMHAFVYRDGEMQDIGTLRDVGGSQATAINNLGQVVGISSADIEMRLHAFLWLPEPAYGLPAGMNDLGALGDNRRLSYAYSVNNAGQVVGAAFTEQDSRAFLYSSGVMTDFNTLIPPDSGWMLLEARGINDAGMVIGYGLLNGEYRAFLLTREFAASDALVFSNASNVVWRLPS